MASVLDKLIQNAKFVASGGFGKGNWGLPEFGLTEQFAGGKTQSILDAQNRKSGNTLGVTTTNTNSPTPDNSNTSGSGSGSGGSYTGLTNNGGSDTNLTDLADTSKQSRIDAIKARMGLIRDVVDRQIGTAKGVRDELVNNIGQTYSNLRTQAEQKKQSSLDTLGQERIDTQDTYGTAKGEARRALESAVLKNRMLARAMGRLNSSFYDDRQAGANETGARNIAGISREEAGKLAGIGTRETDTKNWYDQTTVQLGQEEGQLKTQADREYQQKVDDAMSMEKSFGIDSEDELKQAEVEYQSKLDAINQYIQNKGMRVAEIMATAGVSGGNINSYEAIPESLRNVLSDNSLLTKAQNTDIPTFGSDTVTVPTSSTLAFYNQNQQPTSYLDQLKKLGLYLA